METRTIEQLVTTATELENDDLIPIWQNGQTKKIPAINFFKNRSSAGGLAENQQENVLRDVKDYVDNSNSYSTEEVKTGGTWIDGKPIYRKVIVQDISNGLSGLVSIPIDIANIDTPIRIVCGNISLPDGSGVITIPAQYDATTFVQLGAFSANGLQLYCGTTNWTPLTHTTLCLEYTKTTD